METERGHAGPESGGDSIPEMAARWLARCDRGLTAAEAEELRRWKAADPRHAAELAELQADWANFDLAKAAPDLAREAAELDRQTARKKFRGAPMWVFAAAAAAVIVATGLGLRRNPAPAHAPVAAPNYQVLESAARRVVFDDGSAAEVRGDSEVRADYTNAERRVRLVRGEAHFSVTRDEQRPFVVMAGAATVQAVGTAFNVRFEAEHVEVLVTEGTVQVAESGPVAATASPASPRVTAGERAVIVRRSVESAVPPVEVSPASAAELDRALAWQSRRLVFDRTPLAEAIEAFNLHSSAATGPRIILGDNSLRTRRLGGTFRAANAEAFVRLLEQLVEVRAERQADRIVLFPAR